MKRNRLRFRSRGFTLLEVLLAMAILTGVMITLSQSWSGNFNRSRKITLNNNIAILLERKMADTETKYREKPLSEMPEEESGDFGQDLPGYTWKIKWKKFNMPDLSGIIMAKNEGMTDDFFLNMINQLTEFMSKSIREVTVEISYASPNKKAITYDATTYFVDWSQELSIPGLGGGGTDTSPPSEAAPADTGSK